VLPLPLRKRKDIPDYLSISASMLGRAVLVCFLLVPRIVQAQKIITQFRHFGTSEGLSEGSILCMMQDSKGFIWVGTRHGLNKYDGYTFKHYTAKSYDTSGLQSDVILALCEDSAHTIWVGTRGGGLYALDPKTDRMVHYRFDAKNVRSIASDDIRSLLVDRNRKLWIGTRSEGLNSFDPRTKQFVRYRIPQADFPSDDPNRIEGLFEGDDGRIILNAIHAPSVFDPVTSTAMPFLSDHATKNHRIEYVWPSGVKGKILCSVIIGESKRQICFIDYADRTTVEPLSELPNSALASVGIQPNILRPSNMTNDLGSYLISTTSALYTIRLSSHSIESVLLHSQDLGDITLNDLTCGFVDREHRIWLGTQSGLYVLEENAEPFEKHILHSTEVGDNSSLETVRSLFVDSKGTLHAGTRTGFLFDWQAGKRAFVPAKSPTFKGQSNVTRSPINSMSEDSSGNMWYAATLGPCFIRRVGHSNLENLFCKNDIRSPKIRLNRPFPNTAVDSDQQPANAGYALLHTRDQTMWLGMNDATSIRLAATLLSYDARTSRVRTFSYPEIESTITESRGVYKIYEDHAGGIWIGTQSGLFRVNGQGQSFTSFHYDPKNTRSLNCNKVFVIYEDRRNNFWIGTWGGGLNLMNRRTGEFIHFTEQEGLPSNIVHAILEAKDGTLWISTAKGISHYDPMQNVFINYDVSNGLLDDEFQPNAAVVLTSGEMFFGGDRGVTSFFPERVLSSPSPAPLRITSLSASGNLKRSEMSDGDTIVLSYEESDLLFEYARVDFGNPEKKRYAYFLQGADKHWLQAGARNIGAYSNLEPGQYLLRIKAADARGIWDEKGISITILITPPFWRTWWFELLMFVIASGIVIGWLMKRRAVRRAFQRNLEHARESERLNIAGELHDGPLQDIFATHFLLDGPEMQWSDSGANVRAQVDGLLQKVDGELRTITGELQMPSFDNGFAEAVRYTLSVFSDSNAGIRINSEIEECKFVLGLRAEQNLFRIFRTALSNVQKHSSAKELLVRFLSDETSCTIEIRDDGRGFSVPKQFGTLGRTKHYGLLLMESYALSIGAKLQVQSVVDGGTTIRVYYKHASSLWKKLMLGKKV
jgi:signal transduction histidine kinase/ligand-binding sensor domain-containing protein